MNSLNELFEDCFKDIYNAEKQQAKALPKLAKAAQSPKLKEALQAHLEETNEQIKRLEEVGTSLGVKPTGMVCKGMQGLIEESNEHLQGLKPNPVTDALIIGMAQKNEHYEICGYGTALEYAKLLGHKEAVRLMKLNIAEEEKTDKLLSGLAEGEINKAALEYQPPAPKGASKAAASKAGGDGKASSGAAAAKSGSDGAAKASTAKKASGGSSGGAKASGGSKSSGAKAGSGSGSGKSATKK